MMFVGIGLVLWPVAVFAYTRANARKAAALRASETGGRKFSPEELRKMGDRAPDFVYTL